MARTNKQKQEHEQKLLDAVSYAASCLKKAGDPLHGLGPSTQYADAFDRYSQALKALVAGTCPLHMADWNWNGYEGRFDFYWEFSSVLVQPGTVYEHDTLRMTSRCLSTLDPEKPLLEELLRLRGEAAHYDALRKAMMRWARDARDRSLSPSTAECMS